MGNTIQGPLGGPQAGPQGAGVKMPEQRALTAAAGDSEKCHEVGSGIEKQGGGWKQVLLMR